MYNHFKLIVDITDEADFDGTEPVYEVGFFYDIEEAYEKAQIAVKHWFAKHPGEVGEVVAPVSLWEWMAGALPPRWIEIPIEIEEEVN